MSKIFKEELIFDDKVARDVFYKTIASYEALSDELKIINENGFTFRNDKMVKGSELKKIIEKINIKKELLEELLKEAEKYRIS
ncbi:MAG: hypothetical protein E6583_07370 [Clostridium sp.]|nr:hypothetical protein [Clostridium celatum]MDU6341142.1 hypothetical protein [Clostridium sp.]